jgi:sec-independent protein translocase protein TatC
MNPNHSQPSSPQSPYEESKDFLSHLDDLQAVLIKGTVAVLLGMGVCFFFARSLFDILLFPYETFLQQQETLLFHNAYLIKSLSPYETLTLSMKISFLCGIVVVSPYLLYQVWNYMHPALYGHERRYLNVFFCLSPVLFLIGVLFCYQMVFPIGLVFLWKYSLHMGVLPDWTVSYYMNFIMGFLFAFGLCFQLPIFILILTRLNIVSQALLARKRRYAVVIIFIVAALLSPADIFSQFLLAVPMVALYELSLILTIFMSHNEK